MRRKERAPLSESVIDLQSGLNSEQIAERKNKNYVNNVKIGTSKSYYAIFASNIFTFFNMVCLLVFIWLCSVVESINDIKNLTFMVIILANLLIGIIQEIRAKKTMDKLSLINSPEVKVIRENSEKIIRLNEILLNEVLKLSNGSQVSSDCIIREGNVEVNEALLTGESLPIKKGVGDELLSGSFIVSGECVAEVMHIAEDNYIQKLAIDAKKFKKTDSELLRSLKLIMRIIALMIMPIAILAFLTNWNSELVEIAETTGRSVSNGMFNALGHLGKYTSAELYQAYKVAVTPTSAAMIGMIPAGLFLLTSVALAVGVLKLAKNKALVQELYSIETLARVDMLCLDKTGTITDGTMHVKDIIPLVDGMDVTGANKIIASLQFATKDRNSTANAIIDYCGCEEHYKAAFAIPFASERKCSAVRFEDNNFYILGAPEYCNAKFDDKLAAEIQSYTEKGYRCLLLSVKESATSDEFPMDSVPKALVIIEDNIKADAPEIIKYFKDNGVDVRVISGDNPITVSEVAKRVGIDNADKYISLQNVSDEELEKIALEYTVFGRVSPTQKKILVQIYKKAGKTVAMTGDGINDILALKEANCSIAMANGSEATRNVAQLVLLDSNFASMPKVVGEGRRVVNNIERASSLFLTKTLFSMLLQIILVFMGEALPLEPIQLSFVAFFIIGVPSFFLALEPNNKKINGRFIDNVARSVIPSSIALAINTVLIMVFTKTTGLVPIAESQLNTVVLISLFLVFELILVNVCRPFNRNRLLMVGVVGFAAVACLLFMPFAGNGFINIFKLVHVDNINAVFMIISMFVMSSYIMKIVHYLISLFDYDENKKLRFNKQKLYRNK